MKKIFIATTAVALIAMQSAFAIPTLTLDDGNGHSVTLSDASGVVTFNGTLGNWIVNVTTGIGSPPFPALGTAQQPYLDLQSGNVFLQTGGGPLVGNVLTIKFTDDNLGPVAGGLIHTTGGTANGTTETFSATVNGSPVTTQSITATPGYNQTDGANVVAANPATFGITAVITAHTSAASASFDSEVKVPDAGMTLALLGFGLTGLALFARRKNA
jgi:hypothetical protein